MDNFRQLSFHILGMDVHIRTNSADFVDIFQANYARFLSNPPIGMDNPLVFELIETSNAEKPDPVLIIGGNKYSLAEPHMPGSRFTGHIFYEIQQCISSHILIHAGVVSRDGQGFILAADSMHGKSTLVLELVRRGFKFLSDEMAAIHRRDGQVYPFPRSLRVLPASLQCLGLPLPSGSREWLGKYTIDIEALFPGSMGMPVPIRHVIILTDHFSAPGISNNATDEQMWFYLDGCSPQFLTDLRSQENVHDLSFEDIDKSVKITVSYSQRANIIGRARALARQHKHAWLGSDALTYREADFSQPARLAALSRSQAALQLLRYFQGTHQSALLGHASGSYAAPLFSELARLISQADCHQLFVGPLNGMADLIEAMPAGERS